MLRSMYSGISGMKNFQTKLDVIGNNIANVGTTGFKKGRVTFQDMMSQMSSAAQGNTGVRGGINAQQVGVGSQVGSFDNIQTQGYRQTTNNPLDLMLEGDGMFALGVGAGNDTAINLVPEVGGTIPIGTYTTHQPSYFTRAGNFYLDDAGFVVNPDGYYLLDNLNRKIQIPPEAESFSIQPDGTVYFNHDITSLTAGNDTINLNANGVFVNSNNNTPYTGSAMDTNNIPFTLIDGVIQFPKIGIAKFSNPAGLEQAGSNLFLNTANAGYVGELVNPGTDGAAEVVSGALEMSNVDLAEEFTEMITAQRSFQANTRIITTSDQILEEIVNLKR